MAVGVARVGPEFRASRRIEVSVRCRIDDGNVVRLTRLCNLSAGGARVLTAAPPEVDSNIGLVFALGSEECIIEVRARVVWRSAGFRGRGGVMGIEFLSTDHRDAIEDFVARETLTRG